MTKRYNKALSAEELAAMPDEDINTDDISELNDEFWENARVRYPAEGKERLTVRFDEDMVQWFRSLGSGYQSKMNAVLCSFYEVEKSKARHKLKINE